jgi:hypothetical protein
VHRVRGSRHLPKIQGTNVRKIRNSDPARPAGRRRRLRRGEGQLVGDDDVHEQTAPPHADDHRPTHLSVGSDDHVRFADHVDDDLTGHAVDGSGDTRRAAPDDPADQGNHRDHDEGPAAAGAVALNAIGASGWATGNVCAVTTAGHDWVMPRQRPTNAPKVVHRTARIALRTTRPSESAASACFAQGETCGLVFSH